MNLSSIERCAHSGYHRRMRIVSPARRAALTAALLASAACTTPTGEVRHEPPPAPLPPGNSWDAFATAYLEEYFQAQPFSAVQAGRHEFDGRMPDWSRAGFEREIARLRAARSAAASHAESALGAAQRLEREILLAEIDGQLFWLGRVQDQYRNPAWYAGRLDPDIYLSSNYAPPEKRMAAFTRYARSIPGITHEIRANLRTPMPRTFVEYGARAFAGYADFFRQDVPKVFAAVEDPALRGDFERAVPEAAQAMSELAAWLAAQRASATEAFALGPAYFSEMLRETERLEVPLERLEAIGRADLERNLAALRTACAEFTPGAALADCVARMEARKPEGGAVAGAGAQLAGLRAFLERRGIVSIPGEEEARVAEAPPHRRANFAYIVIPGPYDRGQPATYYIAPPDPSWNAAERAAYVPGEARLLYTTVHEVWPGHFLQFLHTNRNPSKVAALFTGYASAEGWAHYTEEMMWDMGLGESDAGQHVAQLGQALLRNVRYVCAIGMHARGMSLEECERLFRESAFADPGNARQQAARGTYDPAYLNYTLGKLMIRKLRDDWVARQPRTADADPRRHWRDFHDRFLASGAPPIPALRRLMLGEAGGPAL